MSARSCSLTLRTFFMRLAELAQQRPDRGQRRLVRAPLDQARLQLRQGDAGLALGQLPQEVFVARQHRLPVAADLRRARAAGSRTRRTSVSTDHNPYTEIGTLKHKLRLARRIIRPRPPIPRIIKAQAEGSGTAAIVATSVKTKLSSL